MSFTPPRPFYVDKLGNRHLSANYKCYIRSIVGMTPDERKEWRDLGVNLSKNKEARLVDILGTYEFLEHSL